MNFFTRKKSASSAKERLQLVLVHDRTDLTPAQLEALKDDLIKAISNYIEIDPDAVQIGLERDGREQAERDDDQRECQQVEQRPDQRIQYRQHKHGCQTGAEAFRFDAGYDRHGEKDGQPHHQDPHDKGAEAARAACAVLTAL